MRIFDLRQSLPCAALIFAACHGVVPEATSNPPDAGSAAEAEQDLASALEATMYAFHLRNDAWVAHGADFELRVDADDVVLTPALPNAPSFSLRSDAEGEPRAVDARVLGRGEHERIRVGPEGVEQSWVFATRPAADISRSVAIADVELVDSTETGLHFRHRSGTMGLRYGHATWIDASGTQTFVEARWVDDRVVLHVPAELVRRSSFPAVLDPIISPELEVDVSLDWVTLGGPRAPAAASSGAQRMAVWIDRTSGHELLAQRVDAAGNTLDGRGLTLADGWAPRPRYPCVDFDGTNYVVFFLWGPELHAMRVSPSGAILDPTPGVTLAPTAGTLAVAFGGGYHFVVWSDNETYSNIWVRRLRPDLTWEDPAPVKVSEGVPHYGRVPAVAFGGGRVLVTWRHDDYPDNHQLARRFSASGVLEDPAPILVNPDFIDVDNGQGVTVASDGTDFLVAHSREGLWRLRVSRISGSGVLLDTTPVELGPGKHPSLIWDGAAYLLGSVVSLSPGQWGYQVMRIDAAATPPTGSSPVLLQAVGGLEDVRDTLNDPLTFLVSGTPPFAGWSMDAPDHLVGAVFDSSTGTVAETILSPGSNQQASPRLAWNGSAYLLVWDDYRFVDAGTYALRIGFDGTPLDPVGVQVGPSGYSFMPSHPLIAHGSEWVVAWIRRVGTTSTYEIAAQRIDSTGTAVGAPFVVPTDALASSSSWDIASDGAQLYVVWDRSGIHGRRFFIDGTTPDPTPSTLYPWGRFPDLIGNAAGFQVVFEGSGSLPPPIEMVRILPDGAAIDSPPIRIHHSGARPRLTSDGLDYLVSWIDARSAYPEARAQAARVRADGTVVDTGGGFALDSTGPSEAVSVTFDGTDYVAAYDVGPELRLAHVTTSGAVRPSGPHVLAPLFRSGPAVASDGAGDALVAYSRILDAPHRNERVLLRHISRSGLTGGPCSSPSDCDSGFCVDGFCCDVACGGGDTTDCQACSVAAGATMDGVCAPLVAGTACRPGTLPCDPAEACDGVGSACPSDLHAADGTICDDGVLCDGTDACLAGACVTGAAPVCEDGDVCTAGACVEPTGCAFTSIEGCCRDHSECDDGDVCTADACDASNLCEHAEVIGCCRSDGDCDDGQACTTDECNVDAGLCTHGAATGCCVTDTDCDDGVLCTLDACDADTGTCSMEPVAGCCGLDADCDDGDLCTADRCRVDTGGCYSEPVAGCCRADLDCDDGDPCTADACTAEAECEHVPGLCDPMEPEGGCACGAAGRRGGEAPLALMALLLAVVASRPRRRSLR